MTSYYEMTEEQQNRFDYDLVSCLEYNQQPAPLDDVLHVESVLAIWEGRNDAEDWRWVLKLITGEFVLLRGGCDYTGWDCQSWASYEIAHSPEDACLREEELNVQEYLARQVASVKKQTWREMKDMELDITNYELYRR